MTAPLSYEDLKKCEWCGEPYANPNAEGHPGCEPTLCTCEFPDVDGLGVCMNSGCKRKVRP